MGSLLPCIIILSLHAMAFVAFLSPSFEGQRLRPNKAGKKERLEPNFYSAELGSSTYHANFIDALLGSAALPKYPRHWYKRITTVNKTFGEVVPYWSDQGRFNADGRIVGMVVLGPGKWYEEPLDLGTQQHRLYAEVQQRVRTRFNQSHTTSDVFFDVLDSVCIGDYAGGGQGMASSDVHLVPVKTFVQGGRAKC